LDTGKKFGKFSSGLSKLVNKAISSDNYWIGCVYYASPFYCSQVLSQINLLTSTKWRINA